VPTYVAYDGPKRKREEIAKIGGYDARWHFFLFEEDVPYTGIESIQGKRIWGRPSSAWVLPGPVELEVMYHDYYANGNPLQHPRMLAFDAEAGHEYAIAVRRSERSPPYAFSVTDKQDQSLVFDTEPTVDACLARVAQVERAGWGPVDWYHVGRWHVVIWSPVGVIRPAERVEMRCCPSAKGRGWEDPLELDFTDPATLHDVMLDTRVEIQRAHARLEWRTIDESPGAICSVWSGARKRGDTPSAGLTLLRRVDDGLQAGLYERRGPPLSPAEIAAWRSALEEARLP
jgi:hypothetical protein